MGLDTEFDRSGRREGVLRTMPPSPFLWRIFAFLRAFSPFMATRRAKGAETRRVGDVSDEEDTRTAPTRRITRGMDPRDARRARREQGGRGHGEQEGDGLWDDLKQGWDKDASAVESSVVSC